MKLSTAPLLGAVTLAWVSLSCGGPPPAEPRDTQTKVLLLGLDGASWNVMRPMLDRGALPNLARVVEQGVSGPMASDLPCLSIVLWTSVVTGKTPAEHGIRDWSYVDPESGEKGLMDSTKRRVPALWNIVNAARRASGFVNWWASWPAESVGGYIVSEQFMRRKPGERLDGGTFPAVLAGELATVEPTKWPWLSEQLASGALHVLSDRVEGGAQSFEERLRQAAFLYGQDYRGEEALFQLLSTRPHPLVLGYLSRKIDIASHYMWQFGDSERPSDEALSRLLEPVYRYEDELLGRLLETLGPQANVVILSDHGFAWESEGLGHEESAPDGIFLAMGPAFRPGEELERASLYDVTPTVLHLLGLPVGRDMVGKVLDFALSEPREPRFVDSYDFLQTSRTGSPSPVQERILRELEALGYVP